MIVSMIQWGDRSSATSAQVDPESLEFWSIWLTHERAIYQSCLRWMGNAADAEDALSQVMLKAKAKLSEQGKIRNYSAWLQQMARNLCIDIHRQRRRRAVGCDVLEEVAPAAPGKSRADNPADYVLQQELQEFWRGAIAALPPKLRAVMVLRVQQDYSYEEIADQLDLSVANVRKRVSQARHILRRRFADYECG